MIYHHRPRGTAVLAVRTFSLLALAAGSLGAVQLYTPPPPPPVDEPWIPPVQLSPLAQGRSGDLYVRTALPFEILDVPLEVAGDPTHMQYQWMRAGGFEPGSDPRPLLGSLVEAPAEPGFYSFSVLRDGARRIVDGLTIAVMVPFQEKTGPSLNGYRIGTYMAENLDRRERPSGFIEVWQEDRNIQLTRHLRVRDFITRDGQTTWPRYVALDHRVLDKIELVLAEVARARGTDDVAVRVNVHSGFRTPEYNRTVRFAARDSRHQYGDAADIAIDADGDGRFTARDLRIVALAVERVERDHPDLVGGLGLYSSRRVGTPYAHIDVRGRRVRWRG